MSIAVRQFSPDGKYCAYISQQGKFIVYDVETSAVHQVYTPNTHLNVPCTSFTWIQTGGAPQTTPKGKSKKSRTSLAASGQLLVAFGTTKGGVALYSLATGSIEHTCKGDGHTAPITAIYFNAEHNADRIYTAGADGKVIEWSVGKCAQRKVHTIGVEKLTCILAHSRFILTGAKQLKLWDRESGQLVRTLVGHTSNTQLLHLLVVDGDESVYALSGSANDRNLSLWSISGEDGNPVAYFALDDVPEYVSTKLVNHKLHLVAVSRTGVSHYFVRDMGKLSIKKPYRANHTYEVAVDTTGQETKIVDRLPVFVATVQYSPQQEQILLGYGTESHLRFEQITIEADVKTNVVIREPVKLLTGGKTKDGDQKTKTPTVDSAEYLNPVNASKKSVKKVEIPMEVRLENLSLLPDRSGKTAKTGQKNMIHLLVQGLHSKDAELLRQVFSYNEPGMIQQTVQRMPSQYVGALLNELSHMMQMKTMHVETAVCWLKHLITIHSSQLMALGPSNLLENFATCLGIIEYRVEHLNSLSKLRGRLGLLVEQIDRKQAITSDEQAHGNVLVYQEGDDSDVDSMLGKEGTDQLDSSNEDMYDDDDEEVDDDDDDDEEYEEGKMSASTNGLKPMNGHFAVGKGANDDADDDEESEMEVSD